MHDVDDCTDVSRRVRKLLLTQGPCAPSLVVDAPLELVRTPEPRPRERVHAAHTHVVRRKVGQFTPAARVR